VGVVGDDGAAVEQRAVDVLRAVGQRVTRPRVAVVRCVLAAGTDHLSADTLLEQVGALEPSVHRATVYRTLLGLTKAGVLSHVHLDRGLTAYHLADDVERTAHAGSGHRHPAHLHAQCSSCGRVVDLPATVLDDVARRVRQSSGFALDPSHVALSGRCAECVAG
jgi:Fur family ferric uptake transcriptional regulator